MPITITNPFATSEAVLARTAIDDLATKAANVQELCATGYYVSSLSTAGSFPIFVAPFALQIKQAVLVVWNTTLAASDTNYWRLTVRRTRANVSDEIVSKTTQVTGGQGITQRTEWNFDAAVFNATFGLCAKGDAIDFAGFLTGTPAALNGICCTVRYEPV
jgi:hypothetical protein